MPLNRTECESALVNFLTTITDRPMSHLQQRALCMLLSAVERNGAITQTDLDNALWSHNYGPMGGGLPADTDDCSGRFDN